MTKARDALLKRHEIRQYQRSRRNVGIQRASAGTKVKRDDLVMVQEANSTLWHGRVHRKLVHVKWTGAWEFSAIITPGLCCHVVLNGRQVRETRAAASHIKPFHVRPSWLRHGFGDEYAHFAWDADLGLAAPSTMAPPLYTLVDRQASAKKGGARRWEYKGRFLNGTESGWATEEHALVSFTPMQLDVFHAMWELYVPRQKSRYQATNCFDKDRARLSRQSARPERGSGGYGSMERFHRPRRKDLLTPWRHLRLQATVLPDPPTRRRLGGTHQD